MKDSDFELLITSVKQAGQIKRGEIESARNFAISAEDVKAIRGKLRKDWQQAGGYA